MNAYETVLHAHFGNADDIMRNAAVMDTLDWVTSAEYRKVEHKIDDLDNDELGESAHLAVMFLKGARNSLGWMVQVILERIADIDRSKWE